MQFSFVHYIVHFVSVCYYVLFVLPFRFLITVFRDNQGKKQVQQAFSPLSFPVYMILVCLNLNNLIFSNLTALSMTFYSQHTFRHNQILAGLLTMTSTHINTARLNFDPIHFYKACIFIRQAGPDTVLSFQFLGRNAVLPVSRDSSLLSAAGSVPGIRLEDRW